MTMSLRYQGWVSATDRHGYQHGVHAVGRVQGCQRGGHSDVSQPQRGHVREARRVKLAPEVVVRSGSHRREADL
jgi:hypothetical protein